MTKLWLSDFNYLQGPVEEPKSFSKAPGYYYWVLVFFFFVCLFIFSINKFLLTTVNKNLLQIKVFKILLTCRSSSPEVFCRRRVFCGCAEDFRGEGGISMRGCCETALFKLRLCIVVLLWVCFMFAEHLSWGTRL